MRFVTTGSEDRKGEAGYGDVSCNWGYVMIKSLLIMLSGFILFVFSLDGEFGWIG